MPTKAEVEKMLTQANQKIAELEKIDKLRVEEIADLKTRLESSAAALADVQAFEGVLESTPTPKESSVVVWGNPNIVFTDPETGLKTNHEISLTARDGATADSLANAVRIYADALEILIAEDARRFSPGSLDLRSYNSPILKEIREGQKPNGNGTPVGNFDPDNEKVDVPADRTPAPEPEPTAAVTRETTPGRPEGIPDGVSFEGWFEVDSIYWDFKEGTPVEDRTRKFFLVVKTLGKFARHGVLAYSDTQAIPDRIRTSIESGTWANKDTVSASSSKYPAEMKKVAVVKQGEYYKVWGFAA